MSLPKGNVYVIPTYLPVLKLLFTVQQLCIFQKNRREIVLGHRGNKRASAINSIMNIRHTFYVIVNAESLCSILYSSGDIQIKSCWGPADRNMFKYAGNCVRRDTRMWLNLHVL